MALSVLDMLMRVWILDVGLMGFHPTSLSYISILNEFYPQAWSCLFYLVIPFPKLTFASSPPGNSEVMSRVLDRAKARSTLRKRKNM